MKNIFTVTSKNFKRVLGICVAVVLMFSIAVLSSSVFIAKAATISVSYKCHIQNIGWTDWVVGDETCGTTGQSLRMEAVQIKLSDNAPEGMGLSYRAHVQDIGWQDWVTDSEIAGTTGQSLRMEALQVELTGAPEGMSIQYQGHVQSIGWQDLVTGPATAGTIGQSLRMEAVKINLVADGLQLTAATPTLTASKVYDGTTTAASTAGALSGVIEGDVVTVTTSCTYNNANVGTSKTITCVHTLGGADAAKYVKPINYSVATGVITAKPITVTANSSQTKAYGAADPTFTYTVAPALAGSDVFTGALDRAAGTTVGTYAIGQGNLSAGSNYTVTFVPANFSITAKQLTISADPTLTLSKPYDAATTAVATAGSLVGVVEGDTVTVGVVCTYDNASVGTGKTITCVYTLGGAQAAQYTKPVNYVVATGIITAVVIDVSTIPGVAVPTTGAVPASTITETAQYTGTVTWSGGNPAHFADATIYTAYITLTPKTGYTLTGVTGNFFSVAGTSAPATNPPDSGVVTAVFPTTNTTISTKAILGVVAPVGGETPGTTITEATQYTGAVTWSGTPETFEGGTIYTATITLTPKTGYTCTGVGADFFTVAGATVTNSSNSCVIAAVFPRTAASEMTGTVAITGTAKFNQLLTANIAGLIYTPGTTANVPTYAWYRGIGAIDGATASTYTLVEADIANTITVNVAADGLHATGNVTSDPTGTVAKADGPAAPAAPVQDSKTATSVTLVTNALNEFRNGAGAWQTSNVFSGLDASTEYTFTARVKATSTVSASAASTGTAITTNKPVMAGTVAITGTVKYGQVLTANIAGLTYTPTPVSPDVPTYQWYRGVDAIGSATASTYTITTADIGSTIKVIVTADGTNATGSVESSPTAAVANAQLTIAAPTLTLSKAYSGTTTAAATAGSLVGVVGEDVVTVSVVCTYDNANVGTTKTITCVYTLGGADAAKYTKPVDYVSAEGVITAKQLTIADPTLTLSKVYSGDTTAAATAGSLVGIVEGDTVTVSVVCTYDNATIGTGKTITCVYTLGGAQATNYTKPVNYVVATGEITAAPLTAIAAITGTPDVNHVLTAGALTPSAATVTYQWQSADESDGAYSSIGGATSSTYTVAEAYVGKYIKVVATATGNYSGVQTSVPILIASDPLTAIAAITGTSTVGQVLAAGALTPAGATVTYQWRISNTEVGGYANIAGATASTYTVLTANVGKYIKVVATGTGAYTGTATSTATTAVAQKQLTVTAPSLTSTKAYDGNNTAAVTAGSLVGVIEGDTVTVSAVATYNDSSVASGKTITIVYTLAGAQAASYIKPVNDATMVTGAITQKQLTVAAPTLTSTKPYDGNTTAVVTAGALIGKVGAEVVTVSAVADYNDATVASGKTITIVYTLAGTNAGNYIKPVNDATMVTGEITTATISAIGATTGTSRVGSLLTAGALTPAAATATYQWKSAATAEGEYSDIVGATSSTYTIAAAYVDKYIKVAATGSGNYTGTVTSAATAVVAAAPISIAAIAGVVAPATGGTPTATIAATAQYTAAISWLPTDNPFLPVTVYTATITITPKSGYTLTGVGANYFTVDGASATNPINNGVVTAVFPATGAISLVSIGAITGTTTVGSVLTAGALTPAGATVSYQWRVSDAAEGTYADIPSATSSTYTIAGSNVAKYIKVVATGTGGYTGSVTSAATAAIAQKQLTIADPTLTLSKVYSGDTTAAATAGALVGVVPGDTVTVSVVCTYDNATVGTGKTITCVYTLGGAQSAGYIKPVNYVVATGEITAAPLTAIAAITGTPDVNHVLTAGALTPSAATVTYQWQSADESDGAYSSIGGATSSTYTVAEAYVGKYIKVVATATGNYSGAQTSAATAVVAADPITAIAAITGTPTVGQTLTAGALTPAGATVTYQWRISNTEVGGYANIGGATSSTYVVLAANVGKYIKVVATATGAYTGTQTSAPTTAIASAVINIAGLVGVTIPVKSAVPVTTITESAQYTGTITWAPTNNPYLGSTIYTATITLTAKTGYTLTGVAANYFTVAGVSTPATNLINSGVVTAIFPATGA